MDISMRILLFGEYNNHVNIKSLKHYILRVHNAFFACSKDID